MSWDVHVTPAAERPAFPAFYNAEQVGQMFSPSYEEIVAAVAQYRAEHKVVLRREVPAHLRTCLLDIDGQVTFSLVNGELSLAPASVTDSRNVAEFVYRNPMMITDKKVTLDTHGLWHIFHPLFWLDAQGNFVAKYTPIFTADIGVKYFVNPEICGIIWPRMKDPMKKLPWLQKFVVEYTKALAAAGKPPLVVWPIHGRLAHLGHALVPAVAAAFDWHDMLRYTETEYLLKGTRKLVENYSPFGTEVDTVTIDGKTHRVGRKAGRNVARLLRYRMLIVAGEALSHCVRAGLYDIADAIKATEPSLAERVYILEDCTSNVPTFENQGNEALAEFKAMGMHAVKSTTPMSEWPGVPQELLKLAA